METQKLTQYFPLLNLEFVQELEIVEWLFNKIPAYY